MKWIADRTIFRRLAGATFLLSVAVVHSPDAAKAQGVSPPAGIHAASDWLAIVPGNVGFYVEVRDLIGLRRRLQMLGIWHTVREIANARHESTTQPVATQPAGRLPGLSDEDAISELIGRRMALFAPTSAEWKNGVLLAECGAQRDILRWRAQWGARRLPDNGPVQCYLLDGNLRMAVRDRLIALGPAEDRSNLWGQTVALLAGRTGSNLRAQSELASLLARMTSPHDGLAYVAWNKGDPFALAGCERMALGFSLDASELRCEVHGHCPAAAGEVLAPCDVEVIERLPPATLAAWSGSFGGTALTPDGAALARDDYSPMGLFLNRFAAAGSKAGGLAQKLGPRYTVVVGPEPNAKGELRTPPLGVVVDAREPELVAERMGYILDFVTSFARIATVKPGEVIPTVALEHRKIEETTARVVPLGDVLAQHLKLSFLKSIEICWAAQGERLVAATSTDQLAAMLRSLRGKNGAAAIDRVTKTAAAAENGELVQWGLLRGVEVSNLLRHWLGYLRREHPDALSDKWWQQWAAKRTRSRTKFGVALKDAGGAEGGARVVQIDATSPANGLLHVGDIIVATGTTPLPATGPSNETARRYNQRGASQWFRLTVLREGKRLTFAVPVEPLEMGDLGQMEPIRAVRQLIVLLRRVESVRFERRGTDPTWLRLDVTVRWQETPPTATGAPRAQ